MAHFAELDENNVVKRVVVIGNDVPTADGPLGDNDMHPDGEAYCNKLFGGTWKQTSYSHSFRKKYAGAGNIYDPVKDKFLSQQPYPSWSLDANDDWQPPMPFPSIINDGQENPEWIYFIEWNDAKYQADNTIGWEATRSDDEAEIKTKYNWNGTTWTSE